MCVSVYPVFSEGLFNFIEPLASEYDSRLRGVQLSQSHLADKIDDLIRELQACADAASQDDLSEPLARLAAARKRVFASSATLVAVQERLARLLAGAQAKYPDLYSRRQEGLKQMLSERPAEETGGSEE